MSETGRAEENTAADERRTYREMDKEETQGYIMSNSLQRKKDMQIQ